MLLEQNGSDATPRVQNGPDAAPGERQPAPPADPVLEPAERLVHELQDECSDIGVSARGFDLAGFVRGVRCFAREARRYGATPERMLVLLKQCLHDERLPPEDREVYDLYLTTAVRTAIGAYYSSD